MDNHWHLVLWPKRGTDLSRFIGWLCTTHVRRWRAHRENSGEGHVYQGRFKSFLVQRDEHFLTLMSYVEGNRLRAGLVRRAEDWPWSSLVASAGADGVAIELTSWPVDRPRNWVRIVNQPIEPRTVDRLRTSIARGRPFGDEPWVRRTVVRYGLHATVRDPLATAQAGTRSRVTISVRQRLRSSVPLFERCARAITPRRWRGRCRESG